MAEMNLFTDVREKENFTKIENAKDSGKMASVLMASDVSSDMEKTTGPQTHA